VGYSIYPPPPIKDLGIPQGKEILIWKSSWALYFYCNLFRGQYLCPMEFFRGFDKRKELFNCFVKPWSSIERGGGFTVF
jgi:hypothetical protein